MTTRFRAGNPFGVPSGFEGQATPDETRVPSCGIEDLDKAFFTTLRDDVGFQVSNDPGKQQKVPIVFATGEKWSMIKSGRALRDKDGTLILPLVTVRRSVIEQTSEDMTKRGMNQHVGQYVVRSRLDPRDRAYQNLLNKLGLVNSEDVPGERDFDETGSLLTSRDGTLSNSFDGDVLDGGLLSPKLGVNAWQIITLPTPQFYTATYEITFWAQYVSHMNQMLERLMSSYLPTGNRTMKLDTNKGYWFVAYFDEGISSEENVDDSSAAELIRKYKLTVKVPGYIVESGAPGMPSGLRKFVSAPQIAFVTGGEGADTSLASDMPIGLDNPTSSDDPDRQFLLTDPGQHPETYIERGVTSTAVSYETNPFTSRRNARFARIVSRNVQTGETMYRPSSGLELAIISGGSGGSGRSSSVVEEEEEVIPPDEGVAPVLVSLDYSLADTYGGDSITITGTDLTDALTCTIGGTSASITANTDTTLTFTMPAKTAGDYDVVVTTAGGASNALSIEAWSPEDATSATVLHRWRPDQGVTLVGAKVSDLADLVGALDQTQVTEGSRFTFNTANAAYNDKPTISSTGAFMDGATVTAITTPVSIMWIGHLNTNVASLFSCADGGPYNLAYRDGTAVQFFVGPNILSDANSDILLPGVFLYTDEGSGGGSSAAKIYTNDLSTEDDSSTTKWGSVTTVRLGKGTAGTQHCDGTIAEAVVWSGVLDATDRAKLEQYIAVRYTGPAATTMNGVLFDEVGEVYYGSTASGTALGTARVRLRVDSMPGTGFTIIAGPNNGAANNGWIVCTEDTIGGSAVGQLTVWTGVNGALTRIARKFLMPADIGRVFTIHIVGDGAKALVYIDGKRVNVGTACTSIGASTGEMNLDGRSAGTYSNGAVTLIDIAEGTIALTPAQVATDAAAESGSHFYGQMHRYTASDNVGATWADEVGVIDLTRVGSPTVVNFTPTYGNHIGVIEIWGDSIALGAQSGGSYGDGWVRAFQRSLSADYGKACTLVGSNFPSNGTLDYDYWRSAVGGESLTTRLATLASDLAANGPSDASTIMCYGINDIVALSRTAAQLTVDVATAVGLIDAARPGMPIFVANVMSVATNAASAPQHVEIATYQAAFDSMITTLQGTYPNVVGLDYTAAVTDPDDTDVLYDGTHPSPTTYTAIAAIITSVVAGAT